MRIAALCPSWGRPHLARKLQDSFVDIDSIFYLDDDDPKLKEYQVKKALVGPTAPITYLYNILYRQNPEYDAYVLMGDDGVNKSDNLLTSIEIHAQIYPDGIWVAGPADGRGEDSFPHPVVSKGWAGALGYVCPPIFNHWYLDSYTTDLAKACGRFIDLSATCMIAHETPKTGKNPVDDTFKRIRHGMKFQRDNFVASFERYFEADLAILKEAIK